MARKVKAVELTERRATEAAVAVAPPAAIAPATSAGFWGRVSALGAVVDRGGARLEEVDGLLEQWAARRLTFTGMARNLGEVRASALQRAAALRDEAVRRVDASPGAAVTAAVGLLGPRLRALAGQLHALAHRLEGGEAGRPPAA